MTNSNISSEEHFKKSKSSRGSYLDQKQSILCKNIFNLFRDPIPLKLCKSQLNAQVALQSFILYLMASALMISGSGSYFVMISMTRFLLYCGQSISFSLSSRCFSFRKSISFSVVSVSVLVRLLNSSSMSVLKEISQTQFFQT